MIPAKALKVDFLGAYLFNRFGFSSRISTLPLDQNDFLGMWLMGGEL